MKGLKYREKQINNKCLLPNKIAITKKKRAKVTSIRQIIPPDINGLDEEHFHILGTNYVPK